MPKRKSAPYETCGHCGHKVKHSCLWCGEPAVAFCDAWIGSERAGELHSLNDTPHLCDAPMCAEHTKQVGWICGKDADSIDRCPAHVMRDIDMRSAPASLEACKATRNTVWAEARRHRIRNKNRPASPTQTKDAP